MVNLGTSDQKSHDLNILKLKFARNPTFIELLKDLLHINLQTIAPHHPLQTTEVSNSLTLLLGTTIQDSSEYPGGSFGQESPLGFQNELYENKTVQDSDTRTLTYDNTGKLLCNDWIDCDTFDDASSPLFMTGTSSFYSRIVVQGSAKVILFIRPSLYTTFTNTSIFVGDFTTGHLHVRLEDSGDSTIFDDVVFGIPRLGGQASEILTVRYQIAYEISQDSGDSSEYHVRIHVPTDDMKAKVTASKSFMSMSLVSCLIQPLDGQKLYPTDNFPTALEANVDNSVLHSELFSLENVEDAAFFLTALEADTYHVRVQLFADVEQTAFVRLYNFGTDSYIPDSDGVELTIYTPESESPTFSILASELELTVGDKLQLEVQLLSSGTTTTLNSTLDESNSMSFLSFISTSLDSTS